MSFTVHNIELYSMHYYALFSWSHSDLGYKSIVSNWNLRIDHSTESDIRYCRYVIIDMLYLILIYYHSLVLRHIYPFIIPYISLYYLPSYRHFLINLELYYLISYYHLILSFYITCIIETSYMTCHDMPWHYITWHDMT